MLTSKRLFWVYNSVQVTLHEIHNNINICHVLVRRLQDFSDGYNVTMFEVLEERVTLYVGFIKHSNSFNIDFEFYN